MSNHAWFYAPTAQGLAFRHEKATGKVVAIVSPGDNGLAVVEHSDRPEDDGLYLDFEKALAAVEEKYP